MELNEGALILGGMRSDGVSGGEDIGSLGDEGKEESGLYLRWLWNRNVLVLGEARHEEGSHR